MYGSIYRKIIRDVGYIGLSNVLITICGLLSLPLLTKTLGAHDYGVYVQFTVTISLAISFATLGLPYAMVRFLAGTDDKNQISDDFYSSLVLILGASTILSFLFIIFAEAAAKDVFGGYTSVARIIALIIPIECIGWTLTNMFRVFQEVRTYTMVTVLKVYIELAIILLIITNGYGIFEVILSALVVRSGVLIILMVVLGYRIAFKMPRFTRMRKYLSFSLPTVPGNTAAWITNSSNRYLIAVFLGTTYVGYYNPGYVMGGLINMIMFPISFVLIAILTKYFEENRLDVVQRLFNYSLKYFLILAVPATLGISILSRPILILITTPEIADQSYLVTPFVALSMLIFGIWGGILNYSLFLAKKTMITMMNWIIVAAINLSLNIIFIPRMGIIGAAVATLVAYIIGFIFGAYFSFKYFDFIIDYKSIVKIIICSLIMAGLINNLNPSTALDIIFTIIIGTFTYIVAILSIRTINKEEIKFFKSYFLNSAARLRLGEKSL